MPYRARVHAGLTVVLALSLAGLACQSITSEPTGPRPTEARLPNPEGLATDDYGSQLTPAPEGPTATEAGEVVSGPTGSGADYTQPAALGETISIGNWDVRILSYAYGDQAVEQLKGMTDMIDTLPDGRQYVLVELEAISRFNDNENHAVPYDVRLVADNRHGYFSRGFPMVSDPFEGEVRSGESVAGWLLFDAPAQSSEFQLVFSDYDNDFNQIEGYLALTPNAALPAADESQFPDENDIGRDPAAPAKIGETVVTGGFAVTLTEIQRGQEAIDTIVSANSFAPDPGEGQEYALARIRVEAIGREPELQHFSTILFSVQPTSGEPIGLPFLVVPGESPDGALLPGAVLEAWLPLALPVGDDGAVLYYDPTFGFGDQSPARYFALQP